MEIVYFLRDNWQFISTGILTFLSIILLIIKKRPLSIHYDEFFAEIIHLIQEAESVFGEGHGEDKKKYVLSSFLICHPTYGKDEVSDAIEQVLATPTSKLAYWFSDQRVKRKSNVKGVNDGKK